MAVYGLSGQEELYHYGVLGMKWGVRRYQNKDGSLTAAGQRKISKEYKKSAVKVSKKLYRNQNKMTTNAYNRAVSRMNNGELDRFNEAQKKKYGKNFSKRMEYRDDYNKAFNDLFADEFNVSLNNFYSNDQDVKKGKALIEKYGMTSWDELARTNDMAMKEVQNYMEKRKKKYK